ncbi:hypothetical protein WJX72_004477 [[Myrmecia] bisecta]|uniref:Protein disulfide-isomerase n=1 Tax=[Myrmecia] bisecta TaxID=41462 RepID=A0AAW1PH69_9CHLO
MPADPILTRGFTLYVAVFGILSGILVGSVALCVFVGYCFKAHRFPYVWPIKLLRLAVSIFFSLFFISSLNLFLAAVNCQDVPGQSARVMRAFPDVVCWKMPHAILASFSIGMATIFFGVSFCMVMAQSELNPVSHDLLSSPHTIVELQGHVMKSCMCVIHSVLSDYQKLQAVLLLMLSAMIFWSQLRWAPHYISWVNHLRSALYGTLLWSSGMLTALTYAHDQDQRDRVTVALFAGMVGAVIIGALTSFVNLWNMQRPVRKFAKYMAEPEHAKSCKLRDVCKFDNPRQVEICSRVMRAWHRDDTLVEEKVALAELILKAGMDVFSSSAFIHIVYANFLIEARMNETAGYAQLAQVKLLRPNIDERFSAFVREQEHKHRLQSQSTGQAAVDLVSYVEFEKHYRMLGQRHKAAMYATRNFWQLLTHHHVSFNRLESAFKTIEASEKRAYQTYQDVLERYPKSIKLLRSYARFLEEVKNDPHAAQRVNREADKQEDLQQEAHQQNLHDDDTDIRNMRIDDSTDAVVVINSAGVIQLTNQVTNKMFGYKTDELTGKNVSCLMPAPFSHRHNAYVRNYMTTGTKRVLDITREVVALHKERHVFPIMLAVTKVQQANGETAFMGVIKKVEEDDSGSGSAWLMRMSADSAPVLCVNQGFSELLGYAPADIITKQFTSIAANPAALGAIIKAAMARDDVKEQDSSQESRVAEDEAGGGEVPVRLKVSSFWRETEGQGRKQIFSAEVQPVSLQQLRDEQRMQMQIDITYNLIMAVDDKSARAAFGYTPNQLVGRAFTSFVTSAPGETPVLQMVAGDVKRILFTQPASRARSSLGAKVEDAPVVLQVKDLAAMPDPRAAASDDPDSPPLQQVTAKVFLWRMDLLEGAVQIDTNCRITKVNEATGLLLGRDPASLNGQPLQLLFPELPADAHMDLLLAGGDKRSALRGSSKAAPTSRPVGTKTYTAQHADGGTLGIKVVAVPKQRSTTRALLRLTLARHGLAAAPAQAPLLATASNASNRSQPEASELISPDLMQLSGAFTIRPAQEPAERRTSTGGGAERRTSMGGGAQLSGLPGSPNEHPKISQRHRSMSGAGPALERSLLRKESTATDAAALPPAPVEDSGTPAEPSKLAGLPELPELPIPEATEADDTGSPPSMDDEAGDGGDSARTDPASTQRTQDWLQGLPASPRLPKSSSPRAPAFAGDGGPGSGRAAPGMTDDADADEDDEDVALLPAGQPDSSDANAIFDGSSSPPVADGPDDQSELSSTDGPDARGDFARAKRYKRIMNLLSTNVSHAAITRLRSHIKTVAVLAAITHVICASVVLSEVSGHDRAVNTVMSATLCASDMMSICTDTLEVGVAGQIQMATPNISAQALAAAVAPARSPAKMQQFIFDVAENLESDVEYMHFRGSSKHAPGFLKLWDFPSVNITFYQDVETPTYVHESMGLWEAGVNFLAAAREVAVTAGQPFIGNLSADPDWRFIVDNGPDAVGPAYAAAIDIEGVNASVTKDTVMKVLLLLLIFEAITWTLLKFGYVWWMLQQVADERLALYSVFLIVPSAAVKKLASREIRLEADISDSDDEEQVPQDRQVIEVHDREEDEEDVKHETLSLAPQRSVRMMQHEDSMASNPNGTLPPVASEVDVEAGTGRLIKAAGHTSNTDIAGAAHDMLLQRRSSKHGPVVGTPRAAPTQPSKWSGVQSLVKGVTSWFDVLSLAARASDAARQSRMYTTKLGLTRRLESNWRLGSLAVYKLLSPFVAIGTVLFVAYMIMYATMAKGDSLGRLGLASQCVHRAERVRYFATQLLIESSLGGAHADELTYFRERLTNESQALYDSHLALLYGPLDATVGAQIHLTPQQSSLFFTTGDCIREDQSTCYNTTHPFYQATHQGLDTLMLAYYRKAQMLAKDAPAALTPLNERFLFIWEAGGIDLHDGLVTSVRIWISSIVGQMGAYRTALIVLTTFLTIGWMMAIVMGLVGADEEEVASDVLNLTGDDFDEKIRGTKYALVSFTAPWCGHCKTLKPHFNTAAAALKDNEDVFLANVDATVETELAKKYDVSGYPTIFWFDNGEKSAYAGGRTAEEIQRWIKKKTGPPAVTVESEKQLDSIKEDEDVFLLGYFDTFEGEDFETFQKATKATEDVNFYQTTNKGVAKALGLSAPGYAIGTNFEAFGFQSVPAKGHAAFTDNKGDLRNALEEFLQAEKLPPYLEFSQATQPKIFGSGIKKQVLIMGTPEQLAPKGDVIKAIIDAFKAHKGQLVFVTVNKASAEGPNVMKFFEAPEGEDVLVYGFNQDKGHKFKMDGKLTSKSLSAFSKDLIDNKLTVVYKSEPIPTGADAKDGDVVVVVGKNFEDVCLDEERDVLLEVYAPWCGHCKSLAPIYKKLAKRFKKVDSVVIAKLDGTANEHEQLDVKSFPTLIFYPAGKGADAIPYEGERTLKGMTKFLKKHATVPFELKKKEKDDEGHEEL